MPNKDHKVLEQENFQGLYTRGVQDTTPDPYFIDCQNNKFADSDVLSRDGLVLSLTQSNLVRFFVYKRLGETPRFIYLDSSGNLYDSLFPGTPIWTDATFTDFSLLNYNNRAFISPHNRITGIAGKSVLVYEGAGTARLAAGAGPTGFTLGAVNSASSGHVGLGFHLFAVSFLTSSGYITSPGPVLYALVNCPGGFSVDLSNLPIGPTGTIGRVLLATKSIPTSGGAAYTGNQFGYELFFIPGGTINDNTSTTKTVSFFDTDLVNSADYLIDNLSTIPAGVFIMSYSSRMLIGGENANQHTIRVSKPLNPETFDGVAGFMTVDPSEAVSGVRNAGEFRKTLVICKSNRIYSTTDNGNDPNSWSINSVDKSAGTECFGIHTILDARGTNDDRMIIADRSGLLNFEGIVRRPELTYNIEDTWRRINKSHFNLIQVVDDPIYHRFIVSVPLDSATAISHILYADYSKAFIYSPYGNVLDASKLKWSIWTFPSTPVAVSGDVDSVTFDSVIHIALSAGNIYDMKNGLTADFGNAIDSWFRTSLKTAMSGWVNHFGGLRIRVTGSGTLQITLIGEDGVTTSTPPALTLSATPGVELERLVNFFNERMSIKFRVSNTNEKYVIARLQVYAKEAWLRRVS